jgi:uncharacterized metal-binding protein YceD (DUF177 family)
MAKLLIAAESPETWADGGQVIEFAEEISVFSKLEEALGQELGRIRVAEQPANWKQVVVSGRVSFGFADAQSNDVVAAVAVRTEVPLVCQRCLEAFSAPLEVDEKLLLVRDGEAPGRPGYEAWELEEDSVCPLDLADELLVMALPFAALHDDVNCSAGAVADAPAAEETVRPFADLRAQMKAASTPDEPAKD